MSESVSEFFDAQEVLLSASSSENEVGSWLCPSHLLATVGEPMRLWDSKPSCGFMSQEDVPIQAAPKVCKPRCFPFPGHMKAFLG